MTFRFGVGLALCVATVLPVVAPAQASATVRPWDIDVSFGDLARSVSAAKVVGVRSFATNRLNVNWGFRVSAMFGDGIRHLGVGDESDSLFVPKMQLLTANAMIGAGVKLADNIELGVNVDLVGLTLGTDRGGLLVNPGTQLVTVAPVWFNAFGFGSDRTRGSLNSQLFLLYDVSDEWKIRIGYSNLWTDYALQNPVQGSPTRFRSTLPGIFIGGRYTPKD